MITGIVAEFNPFHNGHKYLLDQVDGLKIVVMSGNFMQRGEPAIVDKWTRAKMALANGADIIVELPFLAAVQSADYFAKGALDILAKLGVQQLAFGTEELIDYNKIGQIYCEKEEQMLAYLDQLPADLSYPQKTQLMWEKFTGLTFTGQTPNHILALAYAKAATPLGISLCPIQRQGQGFHSEDKDRQFASATAIRKHSLDHEFIAQVIPSAEMFVSSQHVSWEDYFLYLKYQLLSHPDLTAIYQVNAEMANRLKDAIKHVSTVDDLIDRVATKRYTKARVRRLLTYILVNAVEAPLPQTIHVLGFSAAGQAYLSSIKKSVDLVTRIGSTAWDEATQKADQIYQLGHPGISEQSWGRFPIQ
ncbi:nucleotidyltransferase [Streptococcus fryi]